MLSPSSISSFYSFSFIFNLELSVEMGIFSFDSSEFLEEVRFDFYLISLSSLFILESVGLLILLASFKFPTEIKFTGEFYSVTFLELPFELTSIIWATFSL